MHNLPNPCLVIQDSDDKYYQSLFKFDPKKIQIRILSSSCLHRPSEEFRELSGVDQEQEYLAVDTEKLLNKGFLQSIKYILHPRNRKEAFHEKIIIHIHGGGFIAMSSDSHQSYTRKWANALQVPVFSIDYRKAKDHPYPCGLDDCWQAYNWIVNFVGRYFNIVPKKIILAGDSAGGNLALGVALLCIKYKVRIPDGILLAYPVLDLNFERYTPSMMIPLEDIILPHTFLQLCHNYYVPPNSKMNPEIDPFISPICAADHLLQKLPPIRIVQGDEDIFHDDSWRFVDRVSQFQKNIKMIVYNGMMHGFMHFGDILALKEAKQCI